MVGERILGRFRIESRIGSGGFGTVYRAWDERLQRAVAVKVIDGEHDDPRVTREAQAVARLGHRNIATLYELSTDGSHAYLVSELVEGKTLRELGRRGELTDRLVIGVGGDAAAALRHAHRAGVVHRDVKPENVLVSESGSEAKLVDFGIARIAGEHSLTATGAVLGTLAYMAPEQADGLRPGPSADVYSLSLTLYECLTGEHPHLRESPAATARAIGDPIAPLTIVRADLPEPVTEAIDAGLDPDPDDRPLASELVEVLSANSRQAGDAPLPVLAGPLEADEPVGRRETRPLGAIATAAGIGLLGAAALVVTGAPLPLVAASLLPGALAAARARPAFALQLALVELWLLLGAAEPGTAALVLLLAAPLLTPLPDPRAIPLPGAAPILALIGLAPVYPALCGLTRGAGGRALLGATGLLWLSAWEELAHRALLMGPSALPPAHWRGSASIAVGDVFAPLFEPSVLAAAAIFALAAWALPLFVRGRIVILDSIGALVWAAGLLTGLKLVAPAETAAGLILGVIAAAVIAVIAARRYGIGDPRREVEMPAALGGPDETLEPQPLAHS